MRSGAKPRSGELALELRRRQHPVQRRRARSTTSGGVAAAATTLNQTLASKPGTSLASGGTSGASGKGAAEVLGQRRAAGPPRCCAMPMPKSAKVQSMRPTETSVIASGAAAIGHSGQPQPGAARQHRRHDLQPALP